MRPAVFAVCLYLSACCFGFANTQKPPKPETPPASYQGEALIVQQWDIGFHYNADGTGEQTQHLRVKLQNDAGIRQFSVISVAYAASTQSAQFEKLTVIHADGTTTSTPPSDAIDMPAPVTQQAPLYSDLKILQLPVRGLRAGDTLDYQVRIQYKSAEAPSQFWGDFTFDTAQVVLSQTLTLDIPADKYVQVWSPKAKPTITTADNRRIYHWSGNQLKPTSPDKKKDKDKTPPKPTDNKPSVAWTTFHSWQAVGDWYRSLAAPRAASTDALRAQADQITQNAKTPEQQVAALYTFVSTRIRYIGIDFGIGRFEPHPAAEVLANQYGDCKDKDTLLEALLRAKGFTTAPALIGVNVDMIPDLPSPGLFNHVITTATLPSGQIWMDSTPGVSPFRLLVSPIRDKQALVIPATGPAKLETTPAQPPYPFVDRFEAKATLNADGELNAHVDITDRSDSEILLRAIGRNLAPAQWDQGTQYLVRLLGFGGITSNSDFARADDFTDPMHVSYDYNRKPYGDWDNLRIVPLFPTAFGLPAAPDKQPADKIDLGAERTDIAVATIKLPANFSANLPDAVHVKTPFATFDQTYSLNNGELTTKRTIVILESKLPATSWRQYKKFSDDASLGTLPFIQLTSASTAAAHSTVPQTGNPAAAQLVSQAQSLDKSRNWPAALKKLDEAKDIQPDQPFLWSFYGYVAWQQGKIDEARKDFRHELKLHPDEFGQVLYYAGFLHQHSGDEEAKSILSEAFNRDPSQERIALLLANVQAEANVPDAIATLRKAITASPKNRNLQSLLASDLVRNHQNAEAADIAKKQLDGATDPMALNSASYVLAQTGLDLPLAELKARAALDTLSTQSSQAGIGEANAESFQRTSMLIATWDTLGDILSQENKLDEARDYLAAAWANEQQAPIAAHYGALLEKLHKPAEALRVYEVAPKPKIIADADALLLPTAITRLKKSGIKPVSDRATASTTQQDERTFRLTLKSTHKDFTSATFRLQFSASGIVAVQRVSGSDQLDEANTAIRALHLPQLVPTHSTARILRDAIVTCSPGNRDCYFVLMPLGGIQAEHAGE
ncbi:MAG: DUF3857 domain-containing protein [Acidobacteriaceae bacterium]